MLLQMIQNRRWFIYIYIFIRHIMAHNNAKKSNKKEKKEEKQIGAEGETYHPQPRHLMLVWGKKRTEDRRVKPPTTIRVIDALIGDKEQQKLKKKKKMELDPQPSYPKPFSLLLQPP